MKRVLVILTAVFCLSFSGCGWMDGSYLSVTPHQEQNSGVQVKERSASNYMELRVALEGMVDSGVENAVINLAGYRKDLVEDAVANAVVYAKERYPLGAYAVEGITYEIGTGGGHPAVSVSISYIHGRSEIRQVESAANMAAVQDQIKLALERCSDGIVTWVKTYEAADLVQIVEDYVKENPDVVMEMPQVAVGIYPEVGTSRILEVKFTYETSRESLRQMQQQVRRVFSSAQLYLNPDAAPAQKYAQLYTFLMERFDYQVQTSITPAYSLLSHGVGDSEAFALVYAAMCAEAGLDCHPVSGTKDGKSWHWNIVHEDGAAFHIDLLRCSEDGAYQRLPDEAMEGYVWDYSAYAAEPPVTEPAPTE